MKKLSTLSLSSALFALAALPLLGCAGEGDEDPITVDPSAPIAVVELTNGNQVEFYEPSPGRLFVSELGQAGVAPMAEGDKRPLDLYRELVPGKAAPEALIAAQARADVAPPAPSPTVENITPVANIVAPDTHSFIDNNACDDYWFNNTFCGGSYDWKMCLLNHWNGAYASLSSVDYVHHAVCADIGNVTFKVVMGDGSGVNLTTLEGQYRTYSWRDDCVFGCNESTRGDILNATDNRFHYSVRANF
jgi:hypothetical protein